MQHEAEEARRFHLGRRGDQATGAKWTAHHDDDNDDHCSSADTVAVGGTHASAFNSPESSGDNDNAAPKFCRIQHDAESFARAESGADTASDNVSAYASAVWPADASAADSGSDPRAFACPNAHAGPHADPAVES